MIFSKGYFNIKIITLLIILILNNYANTLFNPWDLKQLNDHDMDESSLDSSVRSSIAHNYSEYSGHNLNCNIIKQNLEQNEIIKQKKNNNVQVPVIEHVYLNMQIRSEYNIIIDRWLNGDLIYKDDYIEFIAKYEWTWIDDYITRKALKWGKKNIIKLYESFRCYTNILSRRDNSLIYIYDVSKESGNLIIFDDPLKVPLNKVKLYVPHNANGNLTDISTRGKHGFVSLDGATTHQEVDNETRKMAPIPKVDPNHFPLYKPKDFILGKEMENHYDVVNVGFCSKLKDIIVTGKNIQHMADMIPLDENGLTEPNIDDVNERYILQHVYLRILNEWFYARLTYFKVSTEYIEIEPTYYWNWYSYEYMPHWTDFYVKGVDSVKSFVCYIDIASDERYKLSNDSIYPNLYIEKAKGKWFKEQKIPTFKSLINLDNITFYLPNK